MKKKILALIMSLALFSTLMVPAFALDATDTDDEDVVDTDSSLTEDVDDTDDADDTSDDADDTSDDVDDTADDTDDTSDDADDTSDDTDDTSDDADDTSDDTDDTSDDTDTSSDSSLSLDIDLDDILNSSIVQAVMNSDGVADITQVVLEVAMTVMSGDLQTQGEELAAGVVESTVDSIAEMIMQMYENSDLIITYDPEKVITNLFDVDLDGDDDADDDEDIDYDSSYDSNELVIGPGDVDGDGKITSADARLILRRAADLITFTDAQNKLADIDGDGEVTPSDARIVLRIAAGLESIDDYT